VRYGSHPSRPRRRAVDTGGTSAVAPAAAPPAAAPPARPRSGAPRLAAPRLAAPRLAAPLLAAALALAACDREKPAPPPAAAPPVAAAPVPAPPAPDSAPPAPATGWDADAGVALVVPADDGGARLVVPGVADSAGVDTARGLAPALPAQVTLLAESGVVGQARAAAAEGAAGRCAAAPAVRLGAASGANALPAWTVGLATAPGGEAPSALPLDSADALAGADSAALAASLTRLAAALPPPRGVSAATGAALRGVPFRVRRARGFAPDGRTRAVVAVLTRTMNQEASPAADAVLLVAERPAGGGASAGGAPTGGAGRWRTAYSERAAGREETLPAVHVLAAVRLDGAGDPRAALVLAREDDAGTRYVLLERREPGRWTARWTSARVSCGR
jgi:hypothetical protein